MTERPLRQYAARAIWRSQRRVGSCDAVSIQGLNCEDPDRKDLLMDIGTEELSHLEVVGCLARMHLKHSKFDREAAEVDPSATKISAPMMPTALICSSKHWRITRASS
jgi:Manganese containing catalase